MQMSSKFLTESTGEEIVKIGEYLAKIWTKYDSLVFWATLYVMVLWCYRGLLMLLIVGIVLVLVLVASVLV